MEFDDIFFTAIAYALGDRVRSFEKTKGETFCAMISLKGKIL
jgi:hypothetical protein